MSTHVHAINQQPHQVQRVERRRPPRIQLRLGLRDKASTDRTLARAPRGDVGAERFQTPRILAGRHTDQHLVDHAPVQRVRIRECPGRWQRNLLAGAPRTGPTNRHPPPAQHDLTRRMPRSRRLARRLMRIPWPTDGGPILFQHGFEYLQARRDDQLLELGLRINEDIDQRQVPWRRGYRLATARDCARLLLHGGSLLGGLHLGFVTGRIARPVKSRRFKFQQLLGSYERAGPGAAGPLSVSRRHRLYRRERFTSERERVEYLVTLYERLRAPLASVAAAKPRRMRRRK